MSDKAINLTFPVKGNDASTAIQSQPPYSTFDSKNVRPFDVIEGRGRGGSRPGLSRAIETQLGGGDSIRLLAAMNTLQSDRYDFWKDSFDLPTFSSMWSQNSFPGSPSIERIDTFSCAVSNDTTKRGMVLAAAATPSMVTTSYRVGIFIPQYMGEHNATYYLYSRMNVGAPLTDSVEAELAFGTAKQITLTVSKYVSGVKTVLGTLSTSYDGVGADGWLVLETTSATTVKCTWRGTTAFEGATGAAAGHNFGFALKASAAGEKALIDRFRVEFYRSVPFELSRPRIYASADGKFYRQKWATTMEQIPSLCTLADDRRLWWAELYGKLLIADFGEPIAGATDGVTTSTTLESATYPDWSAISGLNKYDYSVQIISGTTGTGPNTLAASTHPIASIGTTTLTLGGVSAAAAGTGVSFRIVRNPKIFTPADVAILSYTGGTTNGAGTLLTKSGLALPDGYTVADVVVRIISGTGATAGLYAVSGSGANTLTLATSAGASASSIVFEVLPMSLKPLTSVYPGNLPADASDDTQKGFVPVGCKILVRHQGRALWTGDPSAPQAIYMSRDGDVKDYDYSQEDTQAAYGGATGGDIGRVPDPIIDAMPWYRNYTFLACRSSLHLLIGNPRSGGAIHQISPTIGIAVPGAWCVGPNSEMIFLSRDGLYITNTSCLECQPNPLSRGPMPLELMDVAESQTEVFMAYDVRDQGVHIFLTFKEAREGSTHWWFDFGTKGFFPVEVPSTMEPTSILAYTGADSEDDSVLFGCRDGYTRRHRDSANDDDGTAIDAYVALGPFKTGTVLTDGNVQSIRGVMAAKSLPVDWELYVGRSADEAVANYQANRAVCSGEFPAGFSRTWNPLRRAGAAIVKLISTNGRFAMESITIVAKQFGLFR